MSKLQKLRRAMLFFMFLIFPIIINYLSPYLIIMNISQGIVSGSFIVFSIMLVSSLLLGRFWCGWLCPAGGLQEACEGFIPKKANGRIGHILKWIFWFGWLGLIAYMLIQAGGIQQVSFITQEEGFISILNPAIVYIYIAVVLLVFISTLVLSNRSFCKYICWMEPFMVIGNKLGRLLRLPGLVMNADINACIRCGKCTNECPMSINVQSQVETGSIYSSQCILCMRCAGVCPKDVLNMRMKRH